MHICAMNVLSPFFFFFFICISEKDALILPKTNKAITNMIAAFSIVGVIVLRVLVIWPEHGKGCLEWC